MSQWDKLIKRLYTIPGDMRFEELKKILIRYGYTDNNPRGGSSHHTFRKPGCAPLTIPAYIPIKKIYVRMVKDIIEKEMHAK